MRVITVARKPMEGTIADNVLKHGTGALNIEACRIRLAPSEPDSGAAYYANRGLPMPSNQQSYFGETSGAVVTSTPLPNGRWPANFIVAHRPECVRVGHATVKSDGHYPRARPRGSADAGPSGHAGQEGLQESYTSGETVETWSCAPGCPARELDRQSGHARSSGFRGGTATKRASGSDAGGHEAVRFGAESRPSGTAMILHDDQGGASRFFLQVGGAPCRS